MMRTVLVFVTLLAISLAFGSSIMMLTTVSDAAPAQSPLAIGGQPSVHGYVTIQITPNTDDDSSDVLVDENP